MAEALNRRIDGRETSGSRLAALLSGKAEERRSLTFGDVLFRWARTEPDVVAETDFAATREMSALLSATSSLPRRVTWAERARRTAASQARATFNAAASVSQWGWDGDVLDQYGFGRVAAATLDEVGSDAWLTFSDGDGFATLVNGIEVSLASANNCVGPPPPGPAFIQGAMSGLDDLDGVFPLILPATMQPLTDAIAVCQLANTLAGAATFARGENRAALASVYAARLSGHAGHSLGVTAAHLVFGLHGGWITIVAPLIGGFAGRVTARQFAANALLHTLCAAELRALREAASLHCLAAADTLDGMLRNTQTKAAEILARRAEAIGTAALVMEDWLQRLAHIDGHRRFMQAKLRKAAEDPLAQDEQHGDYAIAVHECALLVEQAGVHPVNVATSAATLRSAITALANRRRAVHV